MNKKAYSVEAIPSISVGSIRSQEMIPVCHFLGHLALFSFFAACTHRWEVLINNTEVLVKRLAETRWSAQMRQLNQ